MYNGDDNVTFDSRKGGNIGTNIVFKQLARLKLKKHVGQGNEPWKSKISIFSFEIKSSTID